MYSISALLSCNMTCSSDDTKQWWWNKVNNSLTLALEVSTFKTGEWAEAVFFLLFEGPPPTQVWCPKLPMMPDPPKKDLACTCNPPWNMQRSQKTYNYWRHSEMADVGKCATLDLQSGASKSKKKKKKSFALKLQRHKIRLRHMPSLVCLQCSLCWVATTFISLKFVCLACQEGNREERGRGGAFTATVYITEWKRSVTDTENTRSSSS